MRLLPLACLALAGFGCGHRGPPVPPLPHLPETPREVRWRQRGDEVQVEARYALQLIGGRPLRPPARPVILHAAAGAGQGAAWDNRARDREFSRVARPLPLPEFASLEQEATTRRDAIPLDAFPAAAEIVMSLTLEDRRSRSLGTRRTALAPARPALPVMSTLAAEPQEKGVLLRWAPSDDPRADAVRIYRWTPDEGEPWDAAATVPVVEGRFLDEGARYGQTVVYLAAYSAAHPRVPIEGRGQRLEPLDYRDTFAPAAPTELDAVAEQGRIRVLWYPGGSPDEKTWIVERQREGEVDFLERGRAVVPDAVFLDEEVEPEVRYRYRVRAEDGAGNRSAIAGPTEWVAPRAVSASPR